MPSGSPASGGGFADARRWAGRAHVYKFRRRLVQQLIGVMRRVAEKELLTDAARRSLRQGVEEAVNNRHLNLSEEESKALIAPIAEQFKTSREKT